MLLGTLIALQVIQTPSINQTPKPRSYVVAETPKVEKSELEIKAQNIVDKITPSWELNKIIKSNSRFAEESKPTISIKVTPGERQGFDASVKLTFNL